MPIERIKIQTTIIINIDTNVYEFGGLVDYLLSCCKEHQIFKLIDASEGLTLEESDTIITYKA